MKWFLGRFENLVFIGFMLRITPRTATAEQVYIPAQRLRHVLYMKKAIDSGGRYVYLPPLSRERSYRCGRNHRN